MLYALVLFALASPLLASDPFAGTWKLNSEKTKYTAGAPAKEVTLVIEEDGTNFMVTASGTDSDGSPFSVKYTVPIKGGKGTVVAGDFNGITSAVSGTNIRENHYTKDGKLLRTRRTVVSKDGKTMQTTVKGTNAMGHEVSGVDFFDKQ
jgi:hypothetical protein